MPEEEVASSSLPQVVDLWLRLKSLALDGVTSPHSRRAYSQALDDFQRWCGTEAAGVSGGFNKATVQRYRVALEDRGLAPSSINLRLSAIRKLATEAADNNLLLPEIAAAIGRVKGAKRHGRRTGNWLRLNICWPYRIATPTKANVIALCSVF